jgi:hypothetical protein
MKLYGIKIVLSHRRAELGDVIGGSGCEGIARDIKTVNEIHISTFKRWRKPAGD